MVEERGSGTGGVEAAAPHGRGCSSLKLLGSAGPVLYFWWGLDQNEAEGMGSLLGLPWVAVITREGHAVVSSLFKLQCHR
jgi:hypothetical protein